MQKYGSQIRERIEETDYDIIKTNEDEVLLKDRVTGNIERWFVNDHHAGYTIEINEVGYEFASSLLRSCDEYSEKLSVA